MTTDLWMLLCAALLQWVLIIAAAVPRIIVKGMPWAMGNREVEGEALPSWTGRLQRASDNLQENLLLFAIVILIVHVSGHSNETSATGAMVFLGARVGHAIAYAIGIPGVRTALWAIGVIGIAIACSALF